MNVDVGTGSPLILVPGIQGRWEYLRPAIDALAQSFRVLSLSLCGERGGPRPARCDLGLDDDAGHIAATLDRFHVERATICGISFGGLPALRFAATYADRTAALVLASTPGPGWRLERRHRTYVRLPWVFAPLFLAESPWRLAAELTAAFPRWSDRLRFALWQLGTLARAPLSPRRMADRASLATRLRIADDCARVAAPTLIITGESELDRIVPAAGTMAYAKMIAGARHVVLDHTGHIGSITRPDRFAAIVRDFAEASRAKGGTLKRAAGS
jgi:pimeloyl-ACP methyl ester carboxylesterase